MLATQIYFKTKYFYKFIEDIFFLVKIKNPLLKKWYYFVLMRLDYFLMFFFYLTKDKNTIVMSEYVSH